MKSRLRVCGPVSLEILKVMVKRSIAIMIIIVVYNTK